MGKQILYTVIYNSITQSYTKEGGVGENINKHFLFMIYILM